MRVSVAMPVYQGEAYLAAQLDSILPQLAPQDELLISDDSPGGETQAIALEYCKQDKRIQYIEGPGRGVCANVAHVLARCSGDVFFLSDQDDIWLPGKREKVLREIESGAGLVLHDAYMVDEQLQKSGETFFTRNGVREGILRNLIKNSYIGCCMAFTGELRDLALPFPKKLPMHDWWLGLLAQRRVRICVLREPLLLYRRHSATVTGKRVPLRRKCVWRVAIGLALLQRLSRKSGI